MIRDFYENLDVHTLNSLRTKLFEEIPDLLFQFNVLPDNTYLFPVVSNSLSEIFELTFDEIKIKEELAIYERVSLVDRESFFSSFDFARKNLKRWEHEFRVNLPIRGERWLKVESKPELQSDESIVFYGRVSDITEIKEQELKLKISEERFQFALEASTEGVWDWDMRTNNVFYSSQSMKILDLESPDIFDNPERWDEIVHPDDLAKYYSDIHEHFDNKVPFYENYHRVLTSNGKYKWILDRGKVIERDDSGRPLRVIGTHTDISAQKEKELELINTTELFREQNSRLVNFSHIVSHNLNTQAGNIKSLLDFIDQEENLNDNREMIGHLRTVSNDLNETIENLTQVVDIRSNINIVRKPLRLNFYLKKALSIIGVNNTKESKITIINTIPEDAIVNFNAAYLESVLLNFTTNAIKYAHPARLLVVKFDFVIEDGVKAMTITDNGLGIDLEKYGDSLFGMYKTFHKHDAARGIGLYITKSQIESMNGRVEVESNVGEGSTFKIIFNDEL